MFPEPVPHTSCINHACTINYLANLKPAALPAYTHRSSGKKPTSAPPRCCWGKFHHRCYCCTSGTLLSCTSQWSTIGWLNGSRLRKLPGTYEGGKGGHWVPTRQQRWNLHYSQQPGGIAKVWPDEASMHMPHLSTAGTGSLPHTYPPPLSLKKPSNSFIRVPDSTFLAVLYKVPRNLKLLLTWSDKTLP